MRLRHLGGLGVGLALVVSLSSVAGAAGPGTLGHVSIKLPAKGHGEFALVEVIGKTNATGDLAIPQIGNYSALPQTIRVAGAELKPTTKNGKTDFRILVAINDITGKSMSAAAEGDALDLILLGGVAAWPKEKPAVKESFENCEHVRLYLKIVAKYLVMGGYSSPPAGIFGHTLDAAC